MRFTFIWSERFTITSSEEALKVCEYNLFLDILAKSSVTCNLPDQLRFIYVNFLHAEYGISRCLEYGFCQINKLEFFISCKTKNARTSFFLLSACVLICTFLWKPNCSPSWWYSFLFYFDISIKFTLLTIISTVKNLLGVWTTL